MQEYDYVPLQLGDEAVDWGINSENNMEQCYKAGYVIKVSLQMLLSPGLKWGNKPPSKKD